MQLGRCNGSVLGRGSLASHYVKSRGPCDGPRESLDGGILLLRIVLQTAVLSGMEVCGKAGSDRVELVLDHAPPVIVVKALDHETVRESASTDDVHCSISGRETGRGNGKRETREMGQGKEGGSAGPGTTPYVVSGTRDAGCGMRESDHE